MIGAAILALLFTMALVLIRAFVGPNVYDRILAVNLFGTKTVLLIIVGGYDKNLSFDELGQKIAANAKAAILLGQTAIKIESAIKLSPQVSLKIQIVNSLSEAVDSAASLAEPGDVVLLSPACASYDMFENFQQRGQEFIKLVREINN